MKYGLDGVKQHESREVAPFVGAWIEIIASIVIYKGLTGRSLRGDVD